MGNKKKYAFLILVVFVVLATTVGHTLAYLTDIDISISRFDVLISEPSEMEEESTESSEPTKTSEPTEGSEPTERSEPTESSEPEESTTESEESASETPGSET